MDLKLRAKRIKDLDSKLIYYRAAKEIDFLIYRFEAPRRSNLYFIDSKRMVLAKMYTGGTTVKSHSLPIQWC